MSPQFSNILIIMGGTFLFILFWAVSIGVVYWDVYRRELAWRQQMAWLAVAALLPVLGFGAYLFAQYLSPAVSERRKARVRLKKRVTQPIHLPPIEEHLPTIPFPDLAQPTFAEGAPGRIPGDGRWSSPSAYSLSLVEGPGAGKEFLVQAWPVSIGRGPEAAIRLDNDPSVSRKHAEITQRAGGLYIRDLNSTHGTEVNGLKIAEQRLKPGDRVRVGVSVLLLQAQTGRGRETRR